MDLVCFSDSGCDDYSKNQQSCQAGPARSAAKANRRVV